MSREVQVRFCEQRWGKFPALTYLRKKQVTIAEKMLFQLHFDVDTVHKATGLTKQELAEILKQTENKPFNWAD